MKAVVQRVDVASVEIDEQEISRIGQGILVLLGVEKGDTEQDATWIAEKVVHLRIFEDDSRKMNLSVKDIDGEILVVSQFTLAGNCSKGRRPSFDTAALPERANILYEQCIQKIKESGLTVATGIFQAEMSVKLSNNGPVTFILEAPKRY